MSSLFVVGVTHHEAPVALRERLAIDAQATEPLTRELLAEGASEVMLLSTCNRVEIYAVAQNREHAFGLLARVASVRGLEPNALREVAFVHEGREAARHLCEVAASLRSMVVGEPQILGQVRAAWARARALGSVGPMLERCVSGALRCAKRVRTETDIGRGAASVPSVSVELARSIFGDLQDCRVLLVGAGKMGAQVAVHLRDAGVQSLVLVNRSQERGRALASRIGGSYEQWTRLGEELRRADVVVTSTGATQPVIDATLAKTVVRERRQRPLFMVDIAVPRDVDPTVSELDHVFLYNIDDLQQIVSSTLSDRHEEARKAGSLVEAEVDAWQQAQTLGPYLRELSERSLAVADAEVEKALRHLPPMGNEEREVLRCMAHAVVKKLLHKPLTNAKKSVQPAGQRDLVQALADLFELNAAATQPLSRPDPKEHP